MTLQDTRSATSSQGSVDGPSHSGSPDGLTTGLCGPEAAPASRSAPQESERARPTSGTSGPSGSPSLHSAVLQSCLESRLRRRMAALGSPEYVLKWKHWDMPSGPPICALRARARKPKDGSVMKIIPLSGSASSSERPTSGSGSGSLPIAGWPTPDAQLMNVFADPQKHQERRGRLQAKHKNGNGAGLPLGQAVHLTGWPTPTAADAIKHGAVSPRPGMMGLSETVGLAGWTTPQTHDAQGTGNAKRLKRHGTKHGCSNLQDQVHLAGWSTPSSRDWKDTPGMSTTGTNPDGSTRNRTDQLPRQAAMASGPTSTCSPASTERRGALNPELSRWLMGYPIAWGSCGAMVTRSSRKSRRNLSVPMTTG